MPQLWRRAGEAAGAAGGSSRQVSGLDAAGGEGPPVLRGCVSGKRSSARVCIFCLPGAATSRARSGLPRRHGRRPRMSRDV